MSDPDQAANTLGVTVNGGSGTTVNGVTVNMISVDGSGVVTANVDAAAGSADASFTLTVTDNTSLSAVASLQVIVLTSCPTAGTWLEQAHPVASDAGTGDQFGYSVSISGDTAVVGAPYDDSPEADRGSAYVYIRSGSTWTQQQNSLRPTAPAPTGSAGA